MNTFHALCEVLYLHHNIFMTQHSVVCFRLRYKLEEFVEFFLTGQIIASVLVLMHYNLLLMTCIFEHTVVHD